MGSEEVDIQLDTIADLQIQILLLGWQRVYADPDELGNSRLKVASADAETMLKKIQEAREDLRTLEGSR